MKTKTQTLYKVIFMQGGRDRLRWREMVGSFPRGWAISHKADLERQGYRALYRTEAEHRSMGMPVGFDSSDREEMFSLGKDGFWWRK